LDGLGALYVCGNGVLEPGEACDDNNTYSSDGCNAVCWTEAGFACSTPPSASASSFAAGHGFAAFGGGPTACVVDSVNATGTRWSVHIAVVPTMRRVTKHRAAPSSQGSRVAFFNSAHMLANRTGTGGADVNVAAVPSSIVGDDSEERLHGKSERSTSMLTRERKPNTT
jgi:cysteine-rich repeat protein